ncbi:uncharacterized protein HD556DRAFT_1312318 [Suillus plorans]|uniref:Uncharacterized protein n=1 Tax=Suillus plorans TaxID=116603 RepID=A0A9P7AGV7_9AGAM|nr:uncharacterized protein HD556DRAFT_1312302 [Suillus plorans]XP_041155324.1 uncharacterized protein HD556DRAFT_1312318 [Suillus plorans]KAG1788020.1 hypothetical protein HD556DRAFT_1312302 [Suillus plorans]KAG1788038.1 hypothetical protein HD556DRAFT_1312318 [Suillus plorans]
MTNPDTAASYNVPENGYFGPVFTTNELTAALQLIRDQVQESAGSSETEYYGPVFAMSELASALKLIHDQDVCRAALLAFSVLTVKLVTSAAHIFPHVTHHPPGPLSLCHSQQTLRQTINDNSEMDTVLTLQQRKFT